MNLRKTLTLRIKDVDVEVDVNFRLIEIIETVYQRGADHVIAIELVQPQLIKRSLVAKVIREWVKPTPGGLSREEVYEAVMTADRQSLPKFVGAIQGAIAYSLRYIGEEELETLASGNDLESAPEVVNKGNPLSSPTVSE